MTQVVYDQLMKDIRYQEWFKIRSHEVDPDKNVTPINILKLMQEASMTNAKELRVSVWELEKENLAWVLIRKSLHVQSYPLLGQKVKVVTYPSSFDRFLAYRDYKMYAENGDLLAYASSTWTLMNTITRRMAKISAELMELKVSAEEKILEPPKSKIPPILDLQYAEKIKIKKYDIDWNGHVNNIQYVKYILENIPQRFIEGSTLKAINFQIKAECYLGEEIVSEYQKSDNAICHQLKAVERDKIVAIAESTWR